MTQEEKLKAIGSFAIFKHLNKRQLKEIAPFLEERTLPAHTLFMKEGNHEEELYLISSGIVRIFYLHETGKEMTVVMRMPGEIIGEMSVIDEMPRSANAETLEQTRLFVLKKDDFLQLLERYPKVALEYLKIFSDRLREAIHAQKNASFASLEDRTYYILQMLSPHFSENGITLTHEQLSVLVNATQPRVTEALNVLKEHNKISLSRKKIIVH